jgi:Protein of unknown function (DUF4231)
LGSLKGKSDSMMDDLNGKSSEFLHQINDLVNSQVMSTRDWYQKNAIWPRRFFRSAGVTVILLSLLIPLLASLSYQGKDLVLSVVAFLIAALTGLNSFFKWEDTWHSRRQTEFTLSHMLAVWRLKMVHALNEPDPAKAKELAISATQQLLDEMHVATGGETKEFFSKVVWPKAGES